jgi:hypothetical protein
MVAEKHGDTGQATLAPGTAKAASAPTAAATQPSTKKAKEAPKDGAGSIELF